MKVETWDHMGVEVPEISIHKPRYDSEQHTFTNKRDENQYRHAVGLPTELPWYYQPEICL